MHKKYLTSNILTFFVHDGNTDFITYDVLSADYYITNLLQDCLQICYKPMTNYGNNKVFSRGPLKFTINEFSCIEINIHTTAFGILHFIKWITDGP